MNKIVVVGILSFCLIGGLFLYHVVAPISQNGLDITIPQEEIYYGSNTAYHAYVNKDNQTIVEEVR